MAGQARFVLVDHELFGRWVMQRRCDGPKTLLEAGQRSAGIGEANRIGPQFGMNLLGPPRITFFA